MPSNFHSKLYGTVNTHAEYPVLYPMNQILYWCRFSLCVQVSTTPLAILNCQFILKLVVSLQFAHLITIGVLLFLEDISALIIQPWQVEL